MLLALAMGLLSGVVGTGLGGLMAGLMWKRGERLYEPLVSMTAGMMLSVVFLELLPVCFTWGGLLGTLAVVGLGIVQVALLDGALSRSLGKKRANQKRAGSAERMKVGLLIAASISLHNLPEGLAIGAGGVLSHGFGLSLAFVIAMHDIPEGLAMGLPLKSGGKSTAAVTLACMLSGLPTALGAMLGRLMGQARDWLIAPCLALAAGAMLYVSSAALLPDAFGGERRRRVGLWLLAGILLGIAVSRLGG